MGTLLVLPDVVNRLLGLRLLKISLKRLHSFGSQIRNALRTIDHQPLMRATIDTGSKITLSVPKCDPSTLRRHDLSSGEILFFRIIL